jgi:hypothetical protein
MAYYLNKPIVIQDYDPQWLQLYAVEEQKLWEVLTPIVVQIEHIGSTSVPGLAAKPIIDISVSVRDLADVTAFVPGMNDLGYEEVPINPTFQRRLFCKDHITKAHITCISQCMDRTCGPSRFCFATTCAPIQTLRPGISRSNAIRPPGTKMTSMATMMRNPDVWLT